MRTSIICALVSAVLLPLSQTSNPDAEGFIRNWLVLAPIAIDGDQGASEIDKDFLKGEAAIKPKADDKVTVGGRELTWKVHQTSDYFIDFLQSFGKERGEYVAGYAVAYVVADEPMKVTLALSTNDQGKAWSTGNRCSSLPRRARSKRTPTRSRFRWQKVRTCWCSRSSTK